MNLPVVLCLSCTAIDDPLASTLSVDLAVVEEHFALLSDLPLVSGVVLNCVDTYGWGERVIRKRKANL